MKRIFSGIQPSGTLHLGNYLGAIKQWVEMQDQVDEAIFCIVDLHAITVPQDPKDLRENILSTAAWYLASGIDPKKSIIFVQSDRPEHTFLAWILNNITSMGQLERMTQFKEKSISGTSENTSVGLFDYPVLMAADILLYQATTVPVGEDQKQHVELARDLAQRFNSRFGETFILPQAVIRKESARIMGLDDPTKKMSKSASSTLNFIALTDDEETIITKIKRAVTDSGSDIKAGADKPAITNLLNIFSLVSGKSISNIEKDFANKGYGDFKADLAKAVVDYLKPIQRRYFELMNDKHHLKEILMNGSERLAPSAEKTLHKIKNSIGLGF